MKKHLTRFALCAAITLIVSIKEAFGGEAVFRFWPWIIAYAALMWGLWEGLLALKKRVRGHVFWIAPAVIIAVFAIGMLIVEVTPGWDGLGIFFMLLFLMANLILAFIFFVIETIVTFIKRKKNGSL